MNYILVDKEPKAVELMEWAKWMSDANRIVKQTQITDQVQVSTVFLGLNHCFGDGDPLFFETMIFGGEHNEYQERYTTWDEAEAGHILACKLVE